MQPSVYQGGTEQQQASRPFSTFPVNTPIFSSLPRSSPHKLDFLHACTCSFTCITPCTSPFGRAPPPKPTLLVK